MIKSVFLRDNQNSLRFFLYKSIPQGKDTRFAYFNRCRFEDEDGHPYPWIKDLHDYVSKRNDGLASMPDAIKRNVEAYRRIHKQGELSEKEKNALKDMETIAGILSTGQKAIVTNPDGEAIEIRKGSVNKSGGLLHIISRRLQERVRGRMVDKYKKDKIIKDTAAVIYLVCDAVKTRSLEKQIRGNWATEKNGIKAVVDKDKNSKRLLTGFDLHNRSEATDAINAVIANYNYKPAFLEIYEQVGAVFTSLFDNITQSGKKSSDGCCYNGGFMI